MHRLAGCVALLACLPAFAAEPAPERRTQLVELVRQDCGSCHGITLKGGLGPSLEPAAMADKDSAQLEFVILHGRRGTPMPPWRVFLTEDEARWIVEALKQGLPK
jgi:cytochrome c55X